MDYKVGDNVKYIFEDGDFVVIATKYKPYEHKLVGEVSVNDGYDYIIVKGGTNKVEPFKHVKAEHIELCYNAKQ